MTADPTTSLSRLDEFSFDSDPGPVPDFATAAEFGRVEAAGRARTNGAAAHELDPSTTIPAGTPAVLPEPPVALSPTGLVSGRFRSPSAAFVVELRVDVDGPRSTGRVSADYFQVLGSTTTYFGSMRVDVVTVSDTATHRTITGIGTYTWSAGAPVVKVVVARPELDATPTLALLQHLNGSMPGASYLCRFESRTFRSVLLEEDRQDTVTDPFTSYDTANLPSGGAGRVLSVVSAYAEAGVEMQSSGTMGVVSSGAGSNGTWSNSELHAAMERNFSAFANIPQWAVWMFHAFAADPISGGILRGIMFDAFGTPKPERQGAAVFYQAIGGTDAPARRGQLRTIVHELGHAFNLLHSFDKARPAALSYMNYPQNFPTGSSATGNPAAYWTRFAFEFDQPELVHLRHAFRNNVIMGGSDFANGAGDIFPEIVEDRTDMRLTVSAPARFTLGAPVCVDLALHSGPRGTAGVRLKPRDGMVTIGVRRPDGRLVAYEPLVHTCVDTDSSTPDTDVIRETAFIHYGRGGLLFDAPGSYRIRARLDAPDGSVILSNELALRVGNPVTEADATAADLMLGEQQGALLYYVGSDWEGFQDGNEALAEVRERFPEHPLAEIAALAQGANARREFKGPRSASTRAPDDELAANILRPIATARSKRATATATILSQAAEVVASPTVLSAEVASYVRARQTELTNELGPS